MPVVETAAWESVCRVDDTGRSEVAEGPDAENWKLLSTYMA